MLWKVDLQLDLYKEVNGLPDAKIFGGRLKLRAFGKKDPETLSTITRTVQSIVQFADLGEVHATRQMAQYKRRAEEAARLGDFEEAIRVYRNRIDAVSNSPQSGKYPLELERARTRLEDLEERIR